MRITPAALAFLMTAPLPSASQTAKTIWEGVSGGYSIRWTTADLTAQKVGSGGIAFSVRQLANRGYQLYQKTMAAEGPCTYERKFEVISVVGPLIAVRDHYYSSCGQEAHPSIASRLTTIDVSRNGEADYSNEADQPLTANIDKPGKIVKLTDFFGDKEIASALERDPIVKEQVDEPGGTLTALLNGLFRMNFEIAKNPCKQAMPRDILTRFAIHHLEGANVAVRLALEPVGGACQSSPAVDLGLLLPQPESLREALKMADARKQGWLQSGGAIPHGQTDIRFEFGKKR